MARDEIHPDLRRIAPFVPRRTVYPWFVPLLQHLPVRGPARRDGVEILTLPSGAGVRLYRPAGATGDTPALLWMHGGGYLLGGPEQDDAAALEDRSCQVHGLPGAFHGFDILAPKSSVAQAYFDGKCAALRGAMALVG